MSAAGYPSTPAGRERATSRLRALTRWAIAGAAGATVAIGVVVAHDRPGAGATRRTATSDGGSSSSTSSNYSSSNSGTTGTTGASPSPMASSKSPTVTSGGTSR